MVADSRSRPNKHHLLRDLLLHSHLPLLASTQDLETGYSWALSRYKPVIYYIVLFQHDIGHHDAKCTYLSDLASKNVYPAQARCLPHFRHGSFVSPASISHHLYHC